MAKVVTFVYEDGHTMIKKLDESMKGLQYKGKRPVEARLNFSTNEILSRVELEQLYSNIAPSLSVDGKGIIYDDKKQNDMVKYGKLMNSNDPKVAEDAADWILANAKVPKQVVTYE